MLKTSGWGGCRSGPGSGLRPTRPRAQGCHHEEAAAEEEAPPACLLAWDAPHRPAAGMCASCGGRLDHNSRRGLGVWGSRNWTTQVRIWISK